MSNRQRRLRSKFERVEMFDIVGEEAGEQDFRMEVAGFEVEACASYETSPTNSPSGTGWSN